MMREFRLLIGEQSGYGRVLRLSRLVSCYETVFGWRRTFMTSSCAKGLLCHKTEFFKSKSVPPHARMLPIHESTLAHS